MYCSYLASDVEKLAHLVFIFSFLVFQIEGYPLSRLRPTYLGRLLPTDLHISFHKLVGRVLFVAGSLHSLGWIFRVSTLGFENAIGGPGKLGNQINSPFPEFATGFVTWHPFFAAFCVNFCSQGPRWSCLQGL